MDEEIDFYEHAIWLFNLRIDKSFGEYEYIARLEKRQFQLSKNLTIADWKQIRDTHYWEKINQIREDSYWDKVEKEIETNEFRGKAIRQYLESL